MVEPIKTLGAENVLANSLERIGASVAHTTQNIVSNTADNYNDENEDQYFNSIPVHTNSNNYSANNAVDMATNEDMNLTTNMLKLVTSATAYKATANALKSVNRTEDDVINQLIGTNVG